MKRIFGLLLAICILISSTLSFYGCSKKNNISLTLENWSDYLEVMTSIYMDGDYLVCEAEAESVSPMIKFNDCLVKVNIIVYTISGIDINSAKIQQALLDLHLNIGGGGSASEKIYVGSNQRILNVKERSVYMVFGSVVVT